MAKFVDGAMTDDPDKGKLTRPTQAPGDPAEMFSPGEDLGMTPARQRTLGAVEKAMARHSDRGAADMAAADVMALDPAERFDAFAKLADQLSPEEATRLVELLNDKTKLEEVDSGAEPRPAPYDQ